MPSLKRKSSRKTKASKRARMELSPSSIVYTGPIIPPTAKGELDTHTQLIGYTALLQSSGAGQITTYFVNNISAATDWASLASLYKEYRVLAIKVDYMPYNRYSKATSTTTTPAIIAVDRSGNTTTPSSYDELMQYSSAQKKSLEDPWSFSCKMSGTEEAQFRPTTSTAPGFGFKFYSDSLSLSTTYGRYFFYWLVQFRGRF